MMAANRWNNLDFERPSERGGDGATQRGGEGATGRRGDGAKRRADVPDPERPNAPGARPPLLSASRPKRSSPAPERLNTDLPPVVTQALGAYMLRSYQAVVDLLEPRLRDDPALPGGQRTLGHALARLNREPEAIDRLREAVRQSPADWLARASLASLLLRAQDEPLPSSHHSIIPSSAAAHLEAALAAAPRPALRELLGAARWRVGQEALQSGYEQEAVRQFAAAGAEFAAAAETSRAARMALPVRQSSAFVGQAVALLLAGQTEAAQRLFSRSPVAGVAANDPLGRFAAGLYELCDELARVSAAERLEAAAALREVVLQVRLAVGFYDGRQAVSLAWTGGLP
jgi:predicted Zn-dependent protease